MTTTEHEDQFAPEPVPPGYSVEYDPLGIGPGPCWIAKGPGVSRMGSWFSESRQACVDRCVSAALCPAPIDPPHNAVAGIYANIRGHRGME